MAPSGTNSSCTHCRWRPRAFWSSCLTPLTWPLWAILPARCGRWRWRPWAPTAPIVGLLLNLFIGIALGANVVIAHAVGQGDEKTIHHAVHTAVIMAVAGGALVAVIGELGVGSLLRMLNVPGGRISSGVAVYPHLPAGVAGHSLIQF